MFQARDPELHRFNQGEPAAVKSCDHAIFHRSRISVDELSDILPSIQVDAGSVKMPPVKLTNIKKQCRPGPPGRATVVTALVFDETPAFALPSR